MQFRWAERAVFDWDESAFYLIVANYSHFGPPTLTKTFLLGSVFKLTHYPARRRPPTEAALTHPAPVRPLAIHLPDQIGVDRAARHRDIGTFAAAYRRVEAPAS